MTVESYSRNKTGVLTAADVAEIKALLIEGGVTQRVIAHRFGVTPGMISHIKTGRMWFDVSPSRGNADDMPLPRRRDVLLTSSQIDSIADDLRCSILTTAEIARKHNVSPSSVSYIRTGRNWSGHA